MPFNFVLSPKQTEMYRAQMNGRYRKRDDSLSELAQDIKCLARLAYPTAPCEVRYTLAYKCFRDALCDQNMEWAICQSTSENIDEVLNLALKFEAFKLGRDRKYTPALRFQQEIGDNSLTPVPLYAMNEKSQNQTQLSDNSYETKKFLTVANRATFGIDAENVLMTRKPKKQIARPVTRLTSIDLPTRKLKVRVIKPQKSF